jgi:hypothetical protein
MIKRLCITLSLACSIYSSWSQFDTSFAKNNIRHCADSLASAFKSKNWELFSLYTSPELIGTMGGKNEFIKYIDMMFSPIPDSAWKKFEPGMILQVIKSAGDLQTVIELKSIIEWQGNRTTTVSHLIGESWDGGLFWTFFDSGDDKSAAMQIKPDLSDQLIVPKKIENTEPISTRSKTKNTPE